MRRILIDECINPRLAPRIRTLVPDGLVETVRDLGLAGQPDHVLIQQIQDRYDVFLTIDKGFEFEHNLAQLSRWQETLSAKMVRNKASDKS